MSLAIGFLIMAGFLALAAYRLAQALKTLQRVLEDVKETTKDVALVKNTIKLGLITFLANAFKKRR